MQADITQLATLAGMTRLVDAVAVQREGVSVGVSAVTPPNSFKGRGGYKPDFLTGWSLALPLATGSTATDMRKLRRGGTGVVLKYQHFSSVISISRKMPMLTAVNIDGTKSRRLPRVSTWNYDGRLDESDQWGEELYGGNALDRGHMVRREDPVWGTPAEASMANVDTFHYTNACPQMAGLNQKTWVGLENYVLDHARADGMRVNVYTGPFFTTDDLAYRGALIPRSFWKVVAIVLPNGRPSATAYKIDQNKELLDLEFVYAGYKTYQISVQQVINDTHIDFSALTPFDGFSQHEAATGTILAEAVDDLSQIRV